MEKMTMLELLSPAGSMDALKAAVQNGADAVYLGCGTFNARQGAKNFTPQTLVEAVKYCHVRGVAVHLTLNTLVSDKETEELCNLIRHAASCCVDAFIVQDLSVVRLCRQIAPKVPIHGSTQMTVHSLPGVLLCAAAGCSRVVLSRELNREEIAAICAASPIEIEVFAHGALCMSYSGQCYLSCAIGGRSGNRGRCAQPCRQSYGYSRWENKHPLSLKDNCLILYLKELQEMGVASIKLEGRMKRAEYVAAVTATYRKALNEGVVTQEMLDTLMKAFNRQGFTDGYYTGEIGSRMFGIREDTREDNDWLKAMRQTYEAVENGLVDVRFQAEITAEGSALTVTDPQGRSCTVTGPVPEAARRLPLTEDLFIARITKTGGTPYRCIDAKATIAPDITLSAAAINGLRRDALDQLTALRARRDIPRVLRPRKRVKVNGFRGRPSLTVQVTSANQITERLLRLSPAVLYVPLHILAGDLRLCRDLTRRVTVAAALPRIMHDRELEKLRQDLRSVRDHGVKSVLVGNIGQMLPVRELGFAIHGDFGLNIYNSGAVEVAKELELESAMLSFEMTLPQIRDVSKPVPCELLAYGRLPLMVTENCLIRGRSGECTCHLGVTRLKDKTGADFPIIKDGDSCRSVLLNGKKLYWLDRQEDLRKLGLWAVRLYFTTENPNEVDQVLTSYLSPAPFDPGACTRGLYLRGLD
ncbi:MAG: U32 family peptidase [Oscillospiraceae bacterium]|nr:U32 family peptidase [Oscillospiraceae bacterium]